MPRGGKHEPEPPAPEEDEWTLFPKQKSETASSHKPAKQHTDEQQWQQSFINFGSWTKEDQAVAKNKKVKTTRP